MPIRSLAVVLLVVLCATISALAQSDIPTFTDRPSFTAAADDLKTLDFEGIAANSGFVQFKREGHFVTAGVDFKPGGGARFGPGHITVVGPWYQAGPMYETTTGAKLLWSPPNQPGNAYLDIFPPTGTTAVGTDFWAAQPSVSPVEITIVTANGNRTFTIMTPDRPAGAFVGVASDSEIKSIRFTTAKGQTGLVIDNFSFGRSRPGEKQVSATTRTETPSGSTKQPVREEPLRDPPGLKPEPGTMTGGGPATSSTAGKIAYVRGGTEIRLIAPDGSNDRQFWTHPEATKYLGINELDWRPDGKELAFSSSHASAASPYHADIYGLGADGTGFRKITNPPDRSELAKFKKGSVTLTIRNAQSSDTTSGTFVIYIAGADEPQQVAIPTASERTVVFKSVADFGRMSQPIVATFGDFRWTFNGIDVVAGRNINTRWDIGGEGAQRQGAYRPRWNSDGSELSYGSGPCLLNHTSAKPAPGENPYNPILRGKDGLVTCVWDHGPTPETANKLIYSENYSSSIYMITDGGPGTKITSYHELENQLPFDLHWIPDGSGFLYSSTVTKWLETSNIYRYDFATKKTTQVTTLKKNEFARAFSISPDSRSVVFERCKDRVENDACDLWTTSITGGDMRLLVKGGIWPAWGK